MIKKSWNIFGYQLSTCPTCFRRLSTSLWYSRTLILHWLYSSRCVSLRPILNTIQTIQNTKYTVPNTLFWILVKKTNPALAVKLAVGVFASHLKYHTTNSNTPSQITNTLFWILKKKTNPALAVKLAVGIPAYAWLVHNVYHQLHFGAWRDAGQMRTFMRIWG